MLKKHPQVGRLVQLPRSIYTIAGFTDGDFLVRVGTGKIQKISEEMMMAHGVLVPKDCCEPKKLAPTQEYVNKQFRALFEGRQQRKYKAEILKGFTIEDEVIEDFVAIAEK